jgi:transcriptional regulator with XRE-family HTH domain
MRWPTLSLISGKSCVLDAPGSVNTIRTMKSKVRVTKSKDMLRVLIGKTLRRWRKWKGDPTQTEVAKLADIPEHWVGGCERGERPIDSVVIARICMALDVPPEAFVADLMKAYTRELKEVVKGLRKGAPAEELQKYPGAAKAQEDMIRSIEKTLDLVKQMLVRASERMDSEEE